MMVYGRWGYVEHNEQSIKMYDKATDWEINDVRDASDGMTQIVRRRQLHNKKRRKSPQDGRGG